nr:hypothetical protein [Tanacetum cinerariifolium]
MEILVESTSNKLMVVGHKTILASDTLIDFQIKFSLSISGIVTHWFTLIVLSALRRSDNENMLSLAILILMSILTDLQGTLKGKRRYLIPAIPTIHNHVLIPNYQDFKIQEFCYSDGFECFQAIKIGRYEHSGIGFEGLGGRSMISLRNGLDGCEEGVSLEEGVGGDEEEDFVMEKGVGSRRRLEWKPQRYEGGGEKCGEDDEEHEEDEKGMVDRRQMKRKWKSDLFSCHNTFKSFALVER